MKHNSKLRKTFHKIQNLEKGNQQRNRKKKGDISKRRSFLMVQEGRKKHKTGVCERRQKMQKENTFVTRRKENGTRNTCVQKTENKRKKKNTKRMK